MARQTPALHAFNQGEISKLALARVDVAKMRLAAESQVNWSPSVTGPMMLRPGTGFMFSTRSDAACWPIPFVFGLTDTALLEITDSHLRVIAGDALVTRASVATTVTNGSFSSGTGWTLSTGAGGTANINSTVSGALYLAAVASGNLVSCVRSVTVAGPDQNVAHALRIVVTKGPVTFMVGTTSGAEDLLARQSLDTGTHSLVVTPTGGTFFVQFQSQLAYGVVVDSIAVESSGTLDLPAPWTASDLANIRFDQSGDIVFIACAGFQQRKIERRNNNSWSVVTYYSDDGPFTVENLDATRKILASGTTGSITLSGTNTAWTSSDVGALFRLNESDLSLVPNWRSSESISVPTEAVPASATYIGDMTASGGLAAAFDGNSATSASKSAGSCYVGRTHSPASAVLSASVSGSAGTSANGSIFSITANLYGKVGSAPANATDGVLLATGSSGTIRLAPGNSSGSFGTIALTSTDFTTLYDNIWVQIVFTFIGGGNVTGLNVSEITMTRFSASGTPVLRRFSGNVYQALGGTTTGVNPPTHTSGDALSENGGTTWRFRNGPFGCARITAVASTTSASADVVRTLPDSVNQRATANWWQSDWNARDGFPTEVKFHEGRLWWFRGDRWWASVSDDFYSFDATVVGESGPINEAFGAGPVASVNFALSLTRLVVGREMSVDPIRSSSFEEPLTPTNVATKACTTKGAAALPALKVGTRAIYVEKSGRRIYELAYNLQAGDYVAHDRTRLNEDIGVPGFVSLAVQEQLYTSEHFVRGDGQVAILLDDPGDEVECWWRVMTLGVIERVVTLPESLEDAVYYVVKRTINGSTKRYWEKVARRSDCVGGSLSKLADCHLSVSQASSTTITGLSHLEGQTVVVWAAGKDLGSKTVSSGQITGLSQAVTTAIVGLGGASYSQDGGTTASNSLTGIPTGYNGYPAEVFANGPNGGPLRHVGAVSVSGGAVALPNGRTATRILAFLGYCATFMSAKLAYAAQMGSPLTRKKKIGHVGLVMSDAHYQGLQLGQDMGILDSLPLIEEGVATAADTMWNEYDEPMIEVAGEWDTDARLCLLAQAPRPVTVQAAVIDVETHG